MSSLPRILLVEDDSAIVTTLRRLLVGEGYEVAVESSGKSGLSRAKDGSFDVVLTDLKLPELGGLELVRELHTARPRLPILMMTAQRKAPSRRRNPAPMITFSSRLTCRNCSN